MRSRIKIIYTRKKGHKRSGKFMIVFAIVVFFILGQGLFCQIAKSLDNKYLKLIVSQIIPLEEEKPAAFLSWQKVFFGFDISSPLTIMQNNFTVANAEEEPAPLPSATPLPEKAIPIKEITVPNKVKSKATTSEGIVVKNNTHFTFDMDSLINEKLKFTIEGDGPSVLIVHSHSSESYTPSNKNFYYPTDPGRTEDKRYNVVRVGDELYNSLKAAGVNAIHDRTLHDYPSYNGSYNSSLKSVEGYLKKYPSIKIVLDIHRDAMVQDDGTKLKVCTLIDGKKTAQIMIVTGTNEGGLDHPNWRENLKFAMKLQRRANLLYPSLMRPVDLARERYNTHTTYGSIILEIGSNGNTLEEALNAADYMGKALADLIRFI